jgi:HKD family nuclease
MQFIAQPFADVRLGEFLLSHLADPQWTAFRAAVAFVKRSGTQHIRQSLRDFSARARARISVGVDLYGTSREGLADLLEATPHGQIFVYRNNGPYTFHPKVYVFKSDQRAEVIIGSGNLTAGGLFTNYEASVAASLNLKTDADADFLNSIEATLDGWSQPQEGLCYLLTPVLLDELIASGLVRTEAQLTEIQQAAAAQQSLAGPESKAGILIRGEANVQKRPLFATSPVPLAPPVAAAPARPASEVPRIEPRDEEAQGILATAVEANSGASAFIVSVLAVDLPVQGSSNEVTITKYIRDTHPEFWGWHSRFSGPDAVTGQYRRNIHIRYADRLISAYLLDFPARKPDGTKASADFRLGSIAAIVADLHQEDDLILLWQSTEPGVDYSARVVRVGEVDHDELMNGMQVYSRSRSKNGTYRKFKYPTSGSLA